METQALVAVCRALRESKEKLMRVTRIVAVVLALLVLAAPTAAADDRGGGGGRHPSVVPVGRVAGSTGGRILGDVFVENLSLPEPASPFGFEVNLCLDVGKGDRVLVPAGGDQDENRVIEMTCRIEVGRPVVLVLPSSDCSTAEPAPFFAVTTRDQRRCAIEQTKPFVKALTVSVDGRPPENVLKDGYFEVSSQRHVVFPQDPVFDAQPGPAKFVAVGWVVQVKGLKRGNHTVTSLSTLVVGANGETAVNTFIVHLEVVGRGKA